MSTRDFIIGEAELGSESDDNDFDDDEEEGTEKQPRKQKFDDSSEEEDDDDEEEEQKIREGFIVDEDEEEEEDSRRHKERRKRRRAQQEDEVLDEEDLDLIGENNPELARPVREEPKFKRLKRGHRDEDISRGAPDLFDSDDEDDGGQLRVRAEDEFDDFIEEDFPDEEAGVDDAEVQRGPTRGFDALKAGLDEDALEDFNLAFGDGTEYEWALHHDKDGPPNQSTEGESSALNKPIELKDVFEPSQLVERLLTDEDNRIRSTDEPERFQIARKPYRNLVLTDDQQTAESGWIAGQMWGSKSLDLEPHLREHFIKAIAKVLEFFNVDEVEPPFVFQHRKDYLIYIEKPTHAGSSEKARPHKLLNQADLWEVFRQDLRYRALTEKRNAIERTYNKLKTEADVTDPVIEELLPVAEEMEQLQDLQEYLYFQHAARLADIETMNGTISNGTRKKPGSGRIVFEKIRASKVYGLVRAFGITADDFAQNAAKQEGRKQYTEDPSDKPELMAASEDIIDPPEYISATQCLRAARAMFAEELFMSPRLRKTVRLEYYGNFVLSVQRTDQGLKRIDELHPYYDFKYLRNQNIHDILGSPGRFLRMLRAEDEGLIEIKIEHRDLEGFKKKLLEELESDNFSEVAEAWNRERRDALAVALAKLGKLMVKSIKEFLKSRSEQTIAASCRDGLYYRLDQAPFKPKGFALGTIPRVLALTNGSGNVGRDPIHWAFIDEDHRLLDTGKLVELQLGDAERGTSDGFDVEKFLELVRHRKPDVIAVSGWSVDTKRLIEQTENLVSVKDLRGLEFEDEDGRRTSELLEVIVANDEVARLYHTSERANQEFPSLAPLTRYAIAIARYLQDPLLEYTSLGKDVTSIQFDKDQNYLPQDIVSSALETAMCDIVNLVGIEINDAVVDQRIASMLPYVAGLGPRKAAHMIRMINANGGTVDTRAELVGDPDQGKAQAVGPRVWNNAASFLYMLYESADPVSDYLDNTRIHPEDYDLGRKMAADALELDEEDIDGEIRREGSNAVVRKLIREDAQEKVNDLILEEYSEQLETKFNQRKRSTLETIRAELQSPFEELRNNFQTRLSVEEKYTMLTGETPEALAPGMTVSLQVKRVSEDSVTGKLDCGLEGIVNLMELPKPIEVSAKTLYQPHQMLQAYIISVSRDFFRAELSLLEEKVNKKYKPRLDYDPDEWDDKQEAADTEKLQPKDVSSGRSQRVVKHPLFRPFSALQAEEYLAQLSRGDLVIRPSSKGPDHLVVTWKVSQGIFQHLDILELNKENEYTVGKILKIGNASYSDLDELIVTHVKAMARKVEEMMNSDKFRRGSRDEANQWLTTYTEANPRRSSYVFCLDPKHPSCFYLCYKKGSLGTLRALNVRVLPRGYSLNNVAYPTVMDLQNGFKSILA